jgi:polyhydroxyalkanoate synthase subunit PhaC
LEQRAKLAWPVDREPKGPPIMPDMPQLDRLTVQDHPPRVTTPADLDRQLNALQSRFTGGRSPSTVALAGLDWAAHAANTPFQAASWGESAVAQWRRLLATALGGPPAIVPPPDDHRFQGDAWQQRAYSLLAQALLLGEEWWDSVIRGQEGVSEPNQRIVAFTVRQVLDMLSPSNIPWLNPEVIEAIQKTGGRNLIAGLENFLRDSAGAAPTGFKVGENLAVTPGKVVFRNERVDPVRAGDREGGDRTGADHFGLDHEILYPGPVAWKFDDPLAGRRRAHGVRHFLAQSARGHERDIARPDPIRI